MMNLQAADADQAGYFFKPTVVTHPGFDQGVDSVFEKKVDFHSHFLSPSYYDDLNAYEDENPDSFPTPAWSAEAHLAQMDRLGIAFR